MVKELTELSKANMYNIYSVRISEKKGKVSAELETPNNAEMGRLAQ